MQSPVVLLATVMFSAIASMAVLGAVIAKFFVLPLRSAPPFITLLITLMIGTVIRESIRLFYPSGSNPQSFPHLLPTTSYHFGQFILRLDTLILILLGVLVIYLVNLLINRSKLGLAIRAVAQDGETARIMGINFEMIVLLTFGLGSGLAALAGVMNGLYYNEVNFGTGLMLFSLGVIAEYLGAAVNAALGRPPYLTVGDPMDGPLGRRPTGKRHPASNG